MKNGIQDICSYWNRALVIHKTTELCTIFSLAGFELRNLQVRFDSVYHDRIWRYIKMGYGGYEYEKHY
jgi:hypothetical protein